MIGGISAVQKHGRRIRCHARDHGGHWWQSRKLSRLGRLLKRLFLGIMPMPVPMPWSVWLTIAVMLGHAVQMGMAAKVLGSKFDGCRHLGSGSQTKTRRDSVLCDPRQSVSLGNQSAGLISTVGQPYGMSGHFQRHRHNSGSRVLGRVRECLTAGHERGG